MGGQRVLKSKPSCLWRQEGTFGETQAHPLIPLGRLGNLHSSLRIPGVSASHEIQLRPSGHHDPGNRFPTELVGATGTESARVEVTACS